LELVLERNGPPRIALYARASANDQTTEGVSIRVQLERLFEYCNSRQWAVAEPYVDEGYPGGDVGRPGYRRMLNERNRWDIVLVLQLAHIHQDPRNFVAMMGDLRKWGKHFVSATESFDTSTPSGRLVIDVLQQVTQVEPVQPGVSVYAGMYRAAKAGRFLGMSDPFGFKYDRETKNLIQVPEEASVIREIFARYFTDRWSMEVIADDLRTRRVPTKRGGHWSKRQIFRVLHSPLCQGSRRWVDIVTGGTHEAIVEANGARSFGKRRPLRRKTLDSRGARQGAS